MNLEQVLAVDEYQFRKPISIVREYMDFAMQMRPQSKVRIIPDYPFGWHAEFAADDRIWMLACVGGFLNLLNVGDCRGIRPNGSFIVTHVEDAIEYEMAFLGTDFYKDSVNSPLTCDHFFINGEPPCFAYCNHKFDKFLTG